MAALDKAIPPPDARSDHLSRKRDKPVTCLDDFQLLSKRVIGEAAEANKSTYASALNRDRIALFRLHVPHPILWEIYASRNKEKIDLTICDRV